MGADCLKIRLSGRSVCSHRLQRLFGILGDPLAGVMKIAQCADKTLQVTQVLRGMISTVVDHN
jgi:hypothetical protein